MAAATHPVISVFLMFEASFWGTCLACHLVRRYVARIPYQLPSARYAEICKTSLFNHIATVLPMITVCLPLVKSFQRNHDPVRYQQQLLPRISLNHPMELILAIVLSTQISDLVFTCMHMLAHSKYLYKRVHAKHHSVRSAFAPSATFCEVAEMLMVNIPAVAAPIFVLRMHPISAVWWICVSACSSVLSHSILSEHHFAHHIHPSNCFGLAYGMSRFMSSSRRGHGDNIRYSWLQPT